MPPRKSSGVRLTYPVSGSDVTSSVCISHRLPLALPSRDGCSSRHLVYQPILDPAEYPVVRAVLHRALPPRAHRHLLSRREAVSPQVSARGGQ